MSLFPFFEGSWKVGKLNVSRSSGSKQVLYAEPFRNVQGNVQEIQVLTSFGHWVKNPEGRDGDTF